MSIFWEIHQYGKIREAQKDADRAHYSARDARSAAQDGRAVADKALLVCEALWSFMHEKLGITEEELFSRIRDLDLSDGQLDGRVRRTPVDCGVCGRTTGRRHDQCLYCGEPIQADPFKV